jgi:hypothetical protein
VEGDRAALVSRPRCPLCLRDSGPVWPLLRRRGGRLFEKRIPPLSSVQSILAVLLPERFRGGCAFGSERASASDLSRESLLSVGEPAPQVKRSRRDHDLTETGARLEGAIYIRSGASSPNRSRDSSN